MSRARRVQPSRSRLPAGGAAAPRPVRRHAGGAVRCLPAGTAVAGGHRDPGRLRRRGHSRRPLAARHLVAGRAEDAAVPGPWIMLAVGLAGVAIGPVGGWVLEHRALGWLLFVGIIAGYLSTGALLTRARTEESAARQQRSGCGAAFSAASSPFSDSAWSRPSTSPRLAPAPRRRLHCDRPAGRAGRRGAPRRARHRRVLGRVGPTGRHGHRPDGRRCRGLSSARPEPSRWYGAVWLFLALLAVAGLAVAIVSGTLADVFAALGVIALMGVTPQQEPLPEALEPGEGQRVLVALGDSYMSGEGADTYYEGTDTGGENQCRRAPTAWAVQASQRYFNGLVFLPAPAPGPTTSVTTHPGTQTPEPRPQDGEPGTELDEYHDLLAARGFDAEPGRAQYRRERRRLLDDRQGVRRTRQLRHRGHAELVHRRAPPGPSGSSSRPSQQVRQTFPDTPVAITAYPDPIYMEPGETEPCDDLALSAGDVRFIKDFLGRLNRRGRGRRRRKRASRSSRRPSRPWRERACNCAIR